MLIAPVHLCKHIQQLKIFSHTHRTPAELVERWKDKYKPDEYGFYKMPIHTMMRIFGDCCLMGNEVFAYGLIYLDEKSMIDEHLIPAYTSP